MRLRRGGVGGEIPAARWFSKGKLKGPNLIQPEAKEDWARGGCLGANIPREAQFHQTAERDS